MRIHAGCLALAVAAVVACNATPEIPNDLGGGSPTMPTRGRAPSSDDTTETDTAPSTPAEDDDTEAPPATTSDAGAPPASDAGTPPPAGGACSGEATMQSCYQCCEEANPGTVDKLNQAFGDCVCAANICGNECASSFCSGLAPAIGSLCDQCIDYFYGVCDDYAVTTCEKDPACAKLFACDDASGCAAKP